MSLHSPLVLPTAELWGWEGLSVQSHDDHVPEPLSLVVPSDDHLPDPFSLIIQSDDCVTDDDLFQFLHSPNRQDVPSGPTLYIHGKKHSDSDLDSLCALVPATRVDGDYLGCDSGHRTTCDKARGRGVSHLAPISLGPGRLITSSFSLGRCSIDFECDERLDPVPTSVGRLTSSFSIKGKRPPPPPVPDPIDEPCTLPFRVMSCDPIMSMDPLEPSQPHDAPPNPLGSGLSSISPDNSSTGTSVEPDPNGTSAEPFRRASIARTIRNSLVRPRPVRFRAATMVFDKSGRLVPHSKSPRLSVCVARTVLRQRISRKRRANAKRSSTRTTATGRRDPNDVNYPFHVSLPPPRVDFCAWRSLFCAHVPYRRPGIIREDPTVTPSHETICEPRARRFFSHTDSESRVAPHDNLLPAIRRRRLSDPSSGKHH
jgi:hypothetical protein